jgi:hypothetical protein
MEDMEFLLSLEMYSKEFCCSSGNIKGGWIAEKQ